MRDRLDDSQVRLMGNDARQISHFEIGVAKGALCGVEHRSDRVLVGLLAVHLDAVQSLIGVVFGDGKSRTASRNVENVAQATVAPHEGANHAVAAASMPQDGRASAVAEE